MADSDICKLCHKQVAKYTCPRCYLRYCSTVCYKSVEHEQCSELFYKDCFMEGLKDINNTEEDKLKMMDMLRCLEDENPELDSDDEGDDDVPDLEERLEGLDLDTDGDKIWGRLSDRERQEFEKMAEDGRLGNVVDLWQPWWKDKDQTKVKEVGAAVAPLTHPRLVHIPDLGTLLKHGTPSPHMPYSIVNVLYGYAYVARLHNGSHGDTPLQTMKEVESIAAALGTGSFPGTSEALHGCLTCLHQKAKSSYVSEDFSVAVLLDVKDIIEGPHQRSPLVYTMAAMSDLHGIARAARKKLDKELKKVPQFSSRGSRLQDEKKHWFGIRKKIEFMLSWIHKFGLQLGPLTMDIDLEFCALSTELASHKDRQDKLETVWGGKRPPRMQRFIEEINDR